jgi:hypothetical protein
MNSQGDLLAVVESLRQHIDTEVDGLKALLASQIESKPHTIKPQNVKVFTNNLVKKILLLGLKLAAKQYDIARSDGFKPPILLDLHLRQSLRARRHNL